MSRIVTSSLKAGTGTGTDTASARSSGRSRWAEATRILRPGSPSEAHSTARFTASVTK